MKKLMIVAAVAAMAGGAYAYPQVYDVKLTVKTTTCKKAKLPKAIANLGWFANVQANQEVAFRGTATRTIGGVIWSCSCTGFTRPHPWRVEGKKQVGVGGYAFWDQTTAPYRLFDITKTQFDWVVLNRVGKMKNLEGTWYLLDETPGAEFFFMGSGFGSCTLDTSDDCASHATSMSGNFAGFATYAFEDDSGCVFCGDDTLCLVAPFCICKGDLGRMTDGLTACFGTWQLKYNASQSKKLERETFITKIRSFKNKNVEDMGKALDAGYIATRTAAKAKAPAQWKSTKAVDALPDLDFEKLVKLAGKADVAIPVTRQEIATLGDYYGNAAKKAGASISDPGKSSTAMSKVAQAIIDMAEHLEVAAEEDDGGDDSGDDEGGDDWGDDDGGDDWDF